MTCKKVKDLAESLDGRIRQRNRLRELLESKELRCQVRIYDGDLLSHTSQRIDLDHQKLIRSIVEKELVGLDQEITAAKEQLTNLVTEIGNEQPKTDMERGRMHRETESLF